MERRPLDERVSKAGLSKDFYVREIVERGLEDLQDYYTGAEAMEQVSKGEVYTLLGGSKGKI